MSSRVVPEPDQDFLPEEWRDELAHELTAEEEARDACGGYFDEEGRMWCDAHGTDVCEGCPFRAHIGRVPPSTEEEELER